MSSSLRRLRANRRNAQKSTGPKTPEGKAISSRNAIKHGLSGQDPAHLIVPGESELTYLEFRAALLQDLKPTTYLQRHIADQIVSTAWRLERLCRIEAEMVDARVYKLRLTNEEIRKDTVIDQPFAHSSIYLPRHNEVGTAFTLEVPAFNCLARYEAHLNRIFQAKLKLLQQMQLQQKPNEPNGYPPEYPFPDLPRVHIPDPPRIPTHPSEAKLAPEYIKDRLPELMKDHSVTDDQVFSYACNRYETLNTFANQNGEEALHALGIPTKPPADIPIKEEKK